MEYSRKKYTILNTAFGIFTRFVALIANFAIRTVFIDYLGIEYTGVSAVFTDILTILSFAELGIGSAITYSLYKPIEEKDFRQIAGIMHLYKQAYRYISLAVLLIGVLLLPFIETIVPNHPNIEEDLRLIFLLYAINSAASYLLIYKSSLLVASQQGYIQSIVNITSYICKAIIQVALIVYFREFVVFLIVEIVFNFLNNLMVTYVANKRFPEVYNHPDERISAVQIKSIFKNVKALSIYRICGVLTNGLTSMLISILVSIEMVGYISNYTLIINQIYVFTLQFFNAATASIGNLAVSKEKDKQEEVFNTLFFFASVFFCLIAVSLFSMLNDFVAKVWLGEKYQISITIVALLCVDFYLKGMATIFNTFRNANGLFRQGQYRPVVMVILNITGALLLYKWLGILGIFVSLVLSRVITQTWFDPLILYRNIFKNGYMKFLKVLLSWMFVLIVSGAITHFINSRIVMANAYACILLHGIVALLVTGLVTFIVFFRNPILRNSVKAFKFLR